MKHGKRTSINGLADSTLRGIHPDELFIRTIATIETGPSRLIQSVYFDGGDILACRGGRFRFSFIDTAPVVIKENEIFVIYPGNTVTIDALEPNSRLNYVVFFGNKVSAYFGGLGLYDGLHFSAPEIKETFQLACELAADNPADPAAISLITDSVQTFFQSWRKQAPCAFFMAIRLMTSNFYKGIVRLQPILDEMKISRSHLYAMFRRQGLPNPGDMIRRTQLREALWQITNTTRPLNEIAQSVGINSPIYFTAFIRRMTGRTPSDIRNRR